MDTTATCPAPSTSDHAFSAVGSDRASSLRLPPHIAATRLGVPGGSFGQSRHAAGLTPRQAVEEQLPARFMPPHPVVNREGAMLSDASQTAKHRGASPGALARDTPRPDLRGAFAEADESGRRIDIPLPFAEHGPVLSRGEALSRVSAAQDGNASHRKQALRATRERLQSRLDESGAALEDIQSAREELVSRNGESQCRNDELEASLEALESANEELHTVNAELHEKVDALDRANADLRNLFDITEVATVFLDGKLVIRCFTPAVAKVFDILPTDTGRPITDLALNLNLTTLASDIEAVFAGGHAIEMTAERDEPAANFLIRIAPYRDGEQAIEGVVVTFIDVTSLTRAEARQRVLIGELQHRTRNLLAIVQSIARQTLGKGGALSDFTARLEALGRVQKLAGGENEERFDLYDIVAMEVYAVVGGETGKVRMAGPPVSLAFQQVQTFTLVLHELCTNALKHGALRPGPGQVEIVWAVEGETPDRSLAFRWRETGVEDMQPPQHRGFGTIMIERASGFARNTRSEMRFDAQGVDWRIKMALPEAPTLVAIAELESSP